LVTSSSVPPGNQPASNESSQGSGGKLLGEIFLELGYITETDLTDALQEAKKTGQYLGAVLVRKGKITREQLGKALARQFNLQYISLSTVELDKALFKLLPEEFMIENQVIPIAREAGRLVVAMVNPRNRRIHDEITFITGMRPKALVTTFMEFQETFTRLAQEGTLTVVDKLKLMEKLGNSKEAGGEKPGPGGKPAPKSTDPEEKSTTLEESSAMLSKMVSSVQTEDNREDQMRQQQMAEMTNMNNPLVKLVNSIIEEGIEKGASDIHIESRTKGCVIRFRIDGILRFILEIPLNMMSSFMTRIKVMSRMDISEHRRPQDGRFATRYKDTEYNMRVNTLPLGEGREKIVIRILRPSKNISDFAVLGVAPDDCKKIDNLYTAPYGIVLVCGPTGSGKTTTLYTILHKINDDERNISTVEDPIELRIEGLNQSQVNTKAEFTFATALRALMRQDPDVIMIGEIRDFETLESAIHASLTGHLVLSTIHANTTAATVTRLVEMGADPAMICSALLGVIAQRLVRTLCEHCKEAYEATPEEKTLLFPKSPEKQQKTIKLYRATGCPRCADSGYSGRVGLYEILPMDRKIRHLVSERKLDIDIEDAAVASGMKTLHIAGMEQLLKGKTSLDEFIRVLGANLGRPL